MKVISNQYIAGFFDGEGSIGIYKAGGKHNSYYLKIQITQNKSKYAEIIFKFLIEKYGGNLSEKPTLSNKIGYRWQVNSYKAVKFLEDILPFLILKKDQAEIGIAWQSLRPKIIRDKKTGRVKTAFKQDVRFNNKVITLMKQLKINDIDVVMENQKDLVRVVAELKQFICIKG